MINRVCANCIHYDVCLLHEDNFIDDVAKNGFCGKFRSKSNLVEVVYCGKCKGFEPHGNGKGGICRNRKCKGLRYATDFCSYGERKDE